MGDLLLKGRVGDSRLVPCFRLATRFQNSWQSHIAVVNPVHCRRVRRRDLSAKGRPPIKGYPSLDCLPLTKISLKYYIYSLLFQFYSEIETSAFGYFTRQTGC
ncbi:MAG: hypothetical protein LBK82_00735 [Planctomycetaceae bacterium]|nr:hypothetical protein [Planctomycetaceae bacterium]